MNTLHTFHYLDTPPPFYSRLASLHLLCISSALPSVHNLHTISFSFSFANLHTILFLYTYGVSGEQSGMGCVHRRSETVRKSGMGLYYIFDVTKKQYRVVLHGASTQPRRYKKAVWGCAVSFTCTFFSFTCACSRHAPPYHFKCTSTPFHSVGIPGCKEKRAEKMQTRGAKRYGVQKRLPTYRLTNRSPCLCTLCFAPRVHLTQQSPYHLFAAFFKSSI